VTILEGLNISFKISAIDDFSKTMNNLQQQVNQITNSLSTTFSDLGSRMRGLGEGAIDFGENFSQAMGLPVAALGGLAVASALTTEEGKKLGEKFTEAFEQVKQALAPVGVIIMQVASEYLPPLVQKVQELSNWFQALSPTMQKVIIGFGALLIALGPVLMFIGAATMGLGGLVSGLGALLSPIGLAIGAILAFASILTYLYFTNDKVRQFLTTTWNVIKTTAVTIFSSLAAFWRSHGDEILAKAKTVWTAIKTTITTIINAVVAFVKPQLDKIRTFWQSNGEQIKQAVTLVWAGIKAVIQTALAVIQSVITVAWNVVKSTTSAVWNAIKGVISGGINVILGIIKTFASILTGDWRGAWEGVKQITKGAIQALGSIVKGVVNIGRNIIDGLISGIKSAAGRLFETAKSIANTVKNTIKKALDIHSPSRVMMELGRFTGEGFALGLDKTLRSIQASAGGLAYATISSVEGSAPVGTTNNYTNNVTVHLTYSGSASRADAYELVDIIERELGNRISSRLRFSGVR
jgi:phage-related protein